MSRHTEHSSFREKLIEHLFIGDLLKLSWADEDCALEVSKPEVDNAGYDLIMELNGVVRHIQLKTSFVGGKTSRQKVHVNLASKLSGCVIWIYFDEHSLELGPFLFFGGPPGGKLPSLDNSNIARHTKADQLLEKAERPNIRVLNKGDFERLETIQSLYKSLFGSKQ